MRTPNSEMSTALKKGPWSHEEDQMLISYISRYGIWNWSQMPRFAGLSRTGKSCRLRWMNYLKPNIKRGNFSKEEDEIILYTHAVLGNKWSVIASRLPGRTDNEVKNHWHAHLKKRAAYYNKTAYENDKNTPLKLQDDNVEKIQHYYEIFESCLKSDHDILSSSSSTATASNDQEINFRDSYYDIGTVDDLQCFWQQLWSHENLDNGNNELDIISYF